MRFRRFGVALLAGSLLALGATSASPAVAQPYPPARFCFGFFCKGSVTQSGATVVFSGSGYRGNTTISIYVKQGPFIIEQRTVTTDGSGNFFVELDGLSPGVYKLIAVGPRTNGAVRVTGAIALV